jgi:hypothetical protein
MFGGATSGIDGRGWDGLPCGDEGLLTDQFGILAVAIDRFGRREGEKRAATPRASPLRDAVDC